MPFGLTNTLATFQRLMETCLGDLQLQSCIIYLDDVIIFVATPASHLESLRAVMQQLRKMGLKLKLRKCKFFKLKLLYLGHIMSKEGVWTDLKKVAVIHEWPVPKNVTEVHSFLGFANHYRRFLKGYAKIA